MSSPDSPYTSNSNLRVFVKWQDQVVFAGEELRCTITFKNVAPTRPPPPASSGTTKPLPSSRHLNVQNGARVRQPSPLSPGGAAAAAAARGGGSGPGSRNNGNGLLPPTPTQASASSRGRGHRSTLSLTVPSAAAASRARAGSIPWSPVQAPASAGLGSGTRHGGRSGGTGHAGGGGNGHKRSVSIVSMGSAGGGDEASAKPARPKGHARASSLQIVSRGAAVNGPRSATIPPRFPPQAQPSPLFHASYPPDRMTLSGRPGAATAPTTPAVLPTRRRSPISGPGPDPISTFKFPMAESPATMDSVRSLDDTLMSPTSTINEMQGIPLRSKDPVPTINEHGATPSARILSTTSIAGTPRSSGEFYSLSNNSSETLASEYVTQQPLRTHGRSQPHNRRTSNMNPSSAARMLPEALMMGYAQVQGSFVLDGSLINLAPFEPVKRKAVVGGQGGGVIGVETSKRDSGLLRSFGWGNFTSSIGELLGGGELSSIKEMRGIASSKSVPLLSTPQSILFVDLQLAPGESKSYEYSFQLPKGLPPTHRGKAMKISYTLVIGTQRPGGAKEQQVKSVEIPFRVLGSVNSHGEILGHDLMTPYIILRDQARIKSIHHPSQPKPQPPSPQSTINSFLTYLDELLSRSLENPNGSLLSPSAGPPSRRQSIYSDHDPTSPFSPTFAASAKEAIDLAIMRANMTEAGQQSANRFEIARNGRRVGVVMLARPAYRLGEVVTLAIDFSAAEIPCYAVHFTLETSERVDSSLALRSEASVHRVTKKVWASSSEAATYARRVVFCPTIPTTATPEFVTSGVSLEWKIRVEFVVPAEEGEGEDEEQTKGGHPLLEEISREDRGGLILVAAENLVCESFEVAVPLRVYGAVCNGLEKLERDEAGEGGLVV